MIDLHIHVLPGVDDGAASLAVAHAMLSHAKTLGFTTIVATPHLDGSLSPEYLAVIEEAAAAVDPFAAELGLTLGLGFEIQLTPDVPTRLERGEPVTLDGSTTVLVELPFSGWPLYTEQTLFAIQAAGFRPLLAHPERYATLQAEPERAFALAERGVLFQVTIASLAGVFGRNAQRVAEAFLVNGVATVLATDAHTMGHRIELVQQGLDRARQLAGAARVRQLVVDNPKALLANEALPSPAPRQPEPQAQGGWRSALRRFTTLGSE